MRVRRVVVGLLACLVKACHETHTILVGVWPPAAWAFGGEVDAGFGCIAFDALVQCCVMVFAALSTDRELAATGFEEVTQLRALEAFDNGGFVLPLH